MEIREQLAATADPREFVILLFDRDPENLSVTDEWLIPTFIGIVKELQTTPDNPNGDGPMQLEFSRVDSKGRYDSLRTLSIFHYESALVGFSYDDLEDNSRAESKRQEILQAVAHTADKLRSTLSESGIPLNFYNMSLAYMEYIDLMIEQNDEPMGYSHSVGKQIMDIISRKVATERAVESD